MSDLDCKHEDGDEDEDGDNCCEELTLLALTFAGIAAVLWLLA